MKQFSDKLATAAVVNEQKLTSLLDPEIQKEQVQTRMTAVAVAAVPDVQAAATAAAAAAAPKILDMKPSLVDQAHHSFNDENDEINRMAAKLRRETGDDQVRYPTVDPGLEKEVVEAAASQVEQGLMQEPIIER